MTIFAPVGNEGIQVAANRKDFMQRLNEATNAGKGLTGLLSNALTLKNRYAVNPNVLAAQKAQLNNQAAMNNAQTPLQGALQRALLGQQQEKVPFMQAQAYKMQHPGNTTTDTINALYAGYSNKNLPVALRNAYGQKLNAMNKRGISLSTSPSGGITFSTGGTGQGGLPMLDANGNPVKPEPNAYQNTGLGAESRHGGMVLKNNKGDSRVTLNKTQQSKDMAQVAAISRVMPQIQELINTSTPTIGAGAEIGRYGQGMLNLLTAGTPNPTNYPLPEAFASRNQRALNIAESLIKSFGLNPTEQNVKSFEASVKPRFGESRQQYAKRMLSTISDLQGISNQGKSRLINGFVINKQGKIINPNWANSFSKGSSEANNGGGVASDSGGKIIVKDKNGNKFYLPKSQLQDALKQGYSRG